LLDAQKRLADHLQTRVRIDLGKRKGKIVVDFVSLEELDRLVDVLMGERAGANSTTVSPD
jgi:ParB family chromosome partitioning protein